MAFIGEVIFFIARGRGSRNCSRQRPRQQAAHVVMGQIDRAVHAGVIPRKARGGK
jgi:hypothetical protein